MKKISSVLLTILFSAVLGFAQDTTGKLVGTVSAPDGAIPGATIVVKDNQTGREQTFTSTDDGTFTVSQLEFGTYTVTITATGYKTLTANAVKIDVGREYPLNAVLEIGAVTEQVTITAGAEQINATNAELSTTISTQQVRELPLNGRNPLTLVRLQAGANPTTNSINGQRSSSTTFSRDGLNVQDNFIRTGGFVQDRPTVDDVSEITVVTQNSGVEQGGGSSVIQLVTPRGGQDLHGALYIFNRNSEFGANSFFNNATVNAAGVGISRPFLNRNEFGGTFSGPLPVPNFGEGGPTFKKDKTFFFFNYEGFRQAQQVATSGTTLLPQARNGDFTYIDNTNPQAPVTRTVNVLTGNGFNFGTAANQTAFTNAGGVLRVDPIIQARFLNNLPSAGNGLTTGTNFTQVLNFQRANGVVRNAYSSRFDYDINDRNSFNVVYKHNTEINDRPEQAAGFSTTPFVTQGGPTDFFVAAYRTTIGSNFSNEVRGGFQISKPFFNETNIPLDYLIGQSLFTSPEGSFRDQGRNTNYRNIQNNSTYTIGNHSLRFGGQIDFYKFDVINRGGTTPTFTISSTTNPNTPGLTANLLTGINATDLARANNLRYTLAGIVGSGSLTANLLTPEQGYNFDAAIDKYNFEIYSGYVSDQWRATRSLTLNLGLRYEFYTPLNTPNPKYLEPVIADPDNIQASLFSPTASLNLVGGNSGTPGNYFKADKDNFAPNVSFAYSPKFESGLFSGLFGGDTVLRGGFRINYVNDEYTKAASTLVAGNAGLGSLNTPGRRADGSQNLRSTFSPSVNPQFEGLPTFATPTVVLPPRLFSTNNANSNFLGSILGVDPNFQVQRNYEYNVGVQRNIGFGTVFEIRYVGGRSDTASRTTDYNQIDIQNNGFLADFRRAQNNCLIQGRTLLTGANDTRNPLFLCTSAAFNPGLAGSQQLTVFNNLAGQGNLTNVTNLAFIQQGRIGSLAQNYINLRQQGTVTLQPTSNAFITEILTNGGKFRYNALQAEVRRRFSNGFAFQANYTFQKTLTDILSDVNADQNRQGRFLDNNNPGLNYGRADYDRTHTFNSNFVLELPFGKGKRFLNGDNGLLNTIFGGFQFSSIISLSSGPPLSITDPRSTFGITGNSGRQGARSSLTTNELKKLTGVFNTPNGIFFFDPKVLFATATAPGQPTLRGFDLNQTLPTGYTLSSVRAASAIDQTPFAGQVFFFNNAGETGTLPINFINGLPYFNWDASLSKNFRFSETTRLQLRLDAFNVLNKNIPFFGADLDINSDNFGRVCGTSTSCSYTTPRVIQFGARFDF